MAIVTYPDRDAWLAARRTGYRIGASDIARIILGAGPVAERGDTPRWCDAFDLWRQHRDPSWKPDSSAQQADGMAWEPLAIREYAVARPGLTVAVSAHTVAVHPCGWLAATPDSWVWEQPRYLGMWDLADGLAEVKTDRNDEAESHYPPDGAEVREWDDADGCPVPPWYWLQIQGQLACTGAEWCDLVVWIPKYKAMPVSRTIRVYPSERWPAIFAALAEWRERHLTGGEPPEPTSPEEVEQIARWKYPAPAGKRKATDRECRLMRGVKSRERRIARLSNEISARRAEIMVSMEGMQQVWDPDIGSVSRTKRGTITMKLKD